MAKAQTTPKASETPVVNPEAGATNGTEAGQPVKEKRPQPERFFNSQLNFQKQRQAESRVTGEFNRLGRKIKAMGLSEETTNAIIELLGKEFQQKAKEAVEKALSEPDATENAGAAGGAEMI